MNKEEATILKLIAQSVCARNKEDKRGVRPVIATIILVAVAIIIAVAVAYWMGGIARTLMESIIAS